MISPNGVISESHYGTDAMFASLARAARLIFDPAFAGIVIKSLLLTILLFAAALALTEFGLAHLPVLGNPFVNRALEWIAPLLFVFGGVIVGPPVAAVFASLFLDQVAGRIEVRDYPGRVARGASFAANLRAGVKLAALVIGVNLVLLPFDIGLPGVGEVLSVAANGWLLGREYFELVALRHITTDDATRVRRANSGAVWFAGVLIALASMIPLLNLVAPLLGTALMVHLFHRLTVASDA
jgi:CysZ protein